ncbi:hypothetical protein BH10BAC2_BH10BAC2_39760 [soil metagenome]
MKSGKNFEVQFSYLIEDLSLQLSAEIELHHSVPHYLVTNIHLRNASRNVPLVADISIKAILTEEGLNWVHTDSERETILSTLIGKEIEKTSMLEVT